MPGRKRTLESEKIDSIVYEKVRDLPSIPIPADQIWQEIKVEHRLHCSTKSLYSRALRLIKSAQLTEIVVEPETSSSATSEEQSYKTSEDEYSKDNLYFMIFLTAKDIENMKPGEIMYKDRSYMKLKSGVWTHIIAEQVSAVSKLPCAFKFTQHFMSKTPNATYFLRIKASCVECGGSLICFAKNSNIRNTDAGIELTCVFKKRKDDISHRRKRQVRGYKRKHLSEKLIEQNLSSSKVRKESVLDHDILFTRESPCLPKTGTLRQIKYESRMKERADVNPIIALGIPAESNPLNRVIHEIGLVRFFLHYWTPEQVRVYNEL